MPHPAPERPPQQPWHELVRSCFRGRVFWVLSMCYGALCFADLVITHGPDETRKWWGETARWNWDHIDRYLAIGAVGTLVFVLISVVRIVRARDGAWDAVFQPLDARASVQVHEIEVLRTQLVASDARARALEHSAQALAAEKEKLDRQLAAMRKPTPRDIAEQARAYSVQVLGVTFTAGDALRWIFMQPIGTRQHFRESARAERLLTPGDAQMSDDRITMLLDWLLDHQCISQQTDPSRQGNEIIQITPLGREVYRAL